MLDIRLMDIYIPFYTMSTIQNITYLLNEESEFI